MGYEAVYQQLKQTLGIDYGETTPEQRFTLLAAPCLGVCEAAPVMLVDGEVKQNVTAQNVEQILDAYK